MNPLDRFLFRWWDPPAAALGTARILFAAWAILLINLDRSSWVADMPPTMMTPPPGLLTLLPGLPSQWFLDTATVVLAVSALLMLVGWRTTAASVTFGLVALLLDGFAYSFGKIDHSILMRVTPILMGIAGWGSALSVDAARRQVPPPPIRTWAVSLNALFLGVAMFSAALPKVLTGWLDPSTQAAEAHVVHNLTTSDSQPLLTQFIQRQPQIARELLDWATVGLEAAPLLLVPWRRLWLWALGGLTVLHLGIFLTLNIPFTGQVLVYFAFAGLAFGPRVRMGWNQLVSHDLAVPVAVITGLLLGVVTIAWGHPIIRPLLTSAPGVLRLVHLLALLVAVGMVLLLGGHRIRAFVIRRRAAAST